MTTYDQWKSTDEAGNDADRRPDPRGLTTEEVYEELERDPEYEQWLHDHGYLDVIPDDEFLREQHERFHPVTQDDISF